MEKLNQWMTLVANVGVVAGIVFLAFEISQNTEQMMSTSIQNLSERMEVVHHSFCKFPGAQKR